MGEEGKTSSHLEGATRDLIGLFSRSGSLKWWTDRVDASDHPEIGLSCAMQGVERLLIQARWLLVDLEACDTSWETMRSVCRAMASFSDLPDLELMRALRLRAKLGSQDQPIGPVALPRIVMDHLNVPHVLVARFSDPTGFEEAIDHLGAPTKTVRLVVFTVIPKSLSVKSHDALRTVFSHLRDAFGNHEMLDTVLRAQGVGVIRNVLMEAVSDGIQDRNNSGSTANDQPVSPSL